MTPSLPTSPAEITPAWLTEVLKGAGLGDVPVRAASLMRIGQNESFTGGGLYRIALEHDGKPEEMPRTLIAKFSPSSPALAKDFYAANKREVEFYSRLAVQGTLPVPRCYFGAVDPGKHASLLLLQDLSDARPVAFGAGLGRPDAAAAIDALAQIHAAFWQSPQITCLDGSAILDEFGFADCWARYPAKVADLLDDITLPAGFLALGDHLAKHLPTIFGDLLDSGPQTCLHRDIHADNLVFARDGRAIVFDWQIVGKGRGVYDVAYLLTSSLTPGMRRSNERDLVARYHAALLARGVAGYSLDQCRTDYLRSVAGKFFVTVVATLILDNATPHKVAWRRTDLERLLAFCADHDITARTFG